ncbi:histidine phosphatase family protein [Erwinia mallotivora]|uniref:Phosphoglycerate mutase n=1 Tax=Erwinia mallotivora TaxID=69222 RepID=A0A014NCL2_9GAMM|nr:histidine phosphatase family protein [Erwinia mallotivora]EXU77143.1 phosphoglycerate mutase [Erwinia mallotivora]
MKKWLLITGAICTGLFTLQGTAKGVDIYLIRHGRTMFNTTGQVQGWSDSPLTEQGIEQAKRAGKGLENIVFTTAFSSDSGRARATAKLILQQNNAANKPELTESPMLREWGYGGYEGRDDAELWQPLFAEKKVEFKKDWSTWETFTSKMSDKEMADAIARNDKTGMAENYAAIVTRLKAGIAEVIRETEAKGGGNSLVVSHGSAIPTILTILTPESYHGESIGNASLTLLHFEEGKFSLVKVGDTRYLSQ